MSPQGGTHYPEDGTPIHRDPDPYAKPSETPSKPAEKPAEKPAAPSKPVEKSGPGSWKPDVGDK